MRKFTATGTVFQPNYPFTGTRFQAIWADGEVTVDGIEPGWFRDAADARDAAGFVVGHPCGPFFRPNDWSNPLAFLWWCDWLAGPTARFEGDEWLAPERPAVPGIEGVDWVR